MRIIHVLRKPLSEGTVASNVLKHGCGGLNIDASRIGTEQVPINRLEVWSGFGQKERPAYIATTSKGRWPANVILQHLDGCRCDGVKTAGSGRFVAHDAVVRGSTMMDPDKGWNGNSLDNSKKNAPNSYGKETVANWVCEPGCPVARLDEQSGDLRARGNIGVSGGGGGMYGHGKTTNDFGAGDTGGASRFYKQVGGKVPE